MTIPATVPNFLAFFLGLALIWASGFTCGYLWRLKHERWELHECRRQLAWHRQLIAFWDQQLWRQVSRGYSAIVIAGKVKD